MVVYAAAPHDPQRPADRMPVDNQLYDRLADTWWNDESVLSLLRTSLNPARFGYMRRVLTQEMAIDPRGRTALDVGSGGGLLGEEFARLGFRVTGIDPSAESVATARAHAEHEALRIDYVVGAGEELPFEDASFDVAYCCDVLEHVNDLDRVLAETARVLKPGGVYLYDTINRTRRSRLVLIKLMQEWRSTALMEPNLHDWEMFIKPAELAAALSRAGLEPCHTVGLGPARNPISMLLDMRRRARGDMTFREFGARNKFREMRDKSMLYAGHAVKPA
jgi:2-polyprenyl-6-hydroxyphenyl methylase/3-demethylubiquinone-9 3-methyltransferase